MREKSPVFRRLAQLLGVSLMMVLLMQAVPAEAKATVRAKVVKTSAKLYKSVSNTKSYIRLKKGAVVTVLGENGKWVKAKARGKTGYIRKSSLKKITTKAALRSKGASKSKKKKTTVRTLKPGNKGAAVKKVQNRLVTKGYLGKSSATGKYGSNTANAVKRFQIINGLSASGTASVATQKKLFSSGARAMPKISMETWSSSGINRYFPYRSAAVIIDVKTGTRINIRRLYGSNHCDVEPKTKSDTAKLKRIYGGKWSWNSRGVLLIAGGKCFAAAINSMPHGGQLSHANGYPGQFCLHLNGSKTHGTNKVNPAHQANIRKVYAYFN